MSIVPAAIKQPKTPRAAAIRSGLKFGTFYVFAYVAAGGPQLIAQVLGLWHFDPAVTTLAAGFIGTVVKGAWERPGLAKQAAAMGVPSPSEIGGNPA